MRHILFFTRLFLYAAVMSLPMVHPAIAVPYDRVGMWFWFFVVPAEMAIAFYLAPPRLRPGAWLAAGGGLLLAFLALGSGWELASLGYLAAGAAAFLLTGLIFHGGGRFNALAVVEQLFLAFVLYKLLGFSRASEELARSSRGITQVILVLIVLAFLLHGMVLYLSAFRRRSRRAARDLVLFLALAVPALVVIALVLPPDFVRNAVAFNRVDRDIRPKPVPLNQRGEGFPGGNLLSERADGEYPYGDGRQGEADGNGQGERPGGNSLEGVPADQWGDSGTGQGQGEGAGEMGKQYAVMVVASPVEPVYVADAYFGDFDPKGGFLYSRDNPLNELTYLRFLETWRDPSPPPDRGRRPVEVFTLSTLGERYLAYRPSAVEPTVLDRRYHPFDFSYRALSGMSASGPRQWARLPELSAEERLRLAHYLEVPLTGEDRQVFERHLASALASLGAEGADKGYYRRIDAVLRSFSTYQYQIGFDDSTSVAKMRTFLAQTKEGDCTEFSNSAAILLRLAGVPSRVVTGYLAARDLQSPAHLQAIHVLREAIEPLQHFPLNELYLVTNAQRHSWVQAYMPGYGWVDLESTAYAIPPPPGRNPSTMNVVIPLIEDMSVPERVFHFPWLLVGQALAALAAAMVVSLYLYRYGREAYLWRLAQGHDNRALGAFYRLLLMKLSVDGYALKEPGQTPAEYAERYPELGAFARLYTRLRYREGAGAEERGRLWGELRRLYRRILERARGSGTGRWLRRAFSLKGLHY